MKVSLCEFFILLFGKWIAVNSYSVQPSCSCYKLVDPCLGRYACCICSHSKGVVCSICSIMYQPAWSPFHSMYVTVSTLGVDTVSDQVNSHQQKDYICRLNCHRSSVGVRFPSTLVWNINPLWFRWGMDHLYCGKCFSRPNTGRSFFEETKADLLSKYLKVSPDKAGMYDYT